jgi:hypothetical protein
MVIAFPHHLALASCLVEPPQVAWRTQMLSVPQKLGVLHFLCTLIIQQPPPKLQAQYFFTFLGRRAAPVSANGKLQNTAEVLTS